MLRLLLAGESVAARRLHFYFAVDAIGAERVWRQRATVYSLSVCRAKDWLALRSAMPADAMRCIADAAVGSSFNQATSDAALPALGGVAGEPALARAGGATEDG